MICCELVEDYDDARDNGRPKSCELHVRDREGGAYPLLVASRLLDLGFRGLFNVFERVSAAFSEMFFPLSFSRIFTGSL